MRREAAGEAPGDYYASAMSHSSNRAFVVNDFIDWGHVMKGSSSHAIGMPAAFHSGKPSSSRRAVKPCSRNRATASKEKTQ